jgi:internalin A
MPEHLSHESWRRRLRISVRGMMVLVLIVGAGLGWVIYRARVQREAGAAIKRAGGDFEYSWQWSNGLPVFPPPKPPWPEWVRQRLGPDLLDTVTYVNLTGQRCDDESLRAACRLPWLLELQVQNTSASDLAVGDIGNLKNLQHLVLNQKNITARTLRQVGEMTELRDLMLGKIPLSDEDMTFLKRLTKLERLMIASRTELTDNWLPNLEGMVNLSSLMLRNMAITTEGLHHLGSLSNLRSLSLEGSRRVTGLEALRPLTKITYLCLANTPIDESALTVLQSWPQLDNLDLRKTNVTDAGVVALSGLSSLRELDLSQTKITDAGLRHLARSNSLRSVFVRQTEVTDAGIAEISKANALITVRR